MAEHAIRQERDGDGILTLVIDCPGLSMNVINELFLADLKAAVERLATEDAIKGAIITSGKKSGFLAGADLKNLDALGGGNGDAKPDIPALFAASFALNALYRALETCGKPVVAAVNGLALGGGLELVLACHHRIVADDAKIRLGFPEVLVGLMPGGGGTQRLPRLVGVQVALPYLLQGRNMNPKEALGLGAVQEVVPADQLLARAKAWVLAQQGKITQPWDQKGFRFPGGAGATNPAFAQTFMAASAIAHKETHGNLHQINAILSAVYEGAQLPMDAAIRIESKYFTKVVADPQARNMVRTLFLSKQAAEKGARRPAGVAQTNTICMGVLGAGLMGSGIAMVSARAGIEVVLLDRTVEQAEKGKSYTADRLRKKHKPESEIAAVLARIHPTADYADLKGCDFVIEAVFEARDVKAAATKNTESVLGADVVFGTNTSTLPITSLATAWSKPENFIGIHFFSPVDRMPLVEIIRGRKTGPGAVAKALDYAARIRKTPIVVHDSRGFYTSRCFGTYVQEGLALLEQGVKPALIENCGRQMGMPVGPLAVNDEVGLDLGYKILEQARKDLGASYKAQPGDAVIDKMMELGRHGRKNGAGFYVYPEDKAPKYLWPELARHFPVAAAQPAAEAVKERLFYRQLVEVVRAMEEGVLDTPEDGDLGAIFGWGFMPFTGGPFSAIDTIGAARVVEVLDRLTTELGPRFKAPELLRGMAAKGTKFYATAGKKAA